VHEAGGGAGRGTQGSVKEAKESGNRRRPAECVRGGKDFSEKKKEVRRTFSCGRRGGVIGERVKRVRTSLRMEQEKKAAPGLTRKTGPAQYHLRRVRANVKRGGGIPALPAVRRSITAKEAGPQYSHKQVHKPQAKRWAPR